jgi:hypothetical protein
MEEEDDCDLGYSSHPFSRPDPYIHPRVSWPPDLCGGVVLALAMTTDPGAVPRDAMPVMEEAEVLEEGKAPGEGRRVRRYCRK